LPGGCLAVVQAVSLARRCVVEKEGPDEPGSSGDEVAVSEDYDTSDVLLIDRETYDSFAGAWPEGEAAGGQDGPFRQATRGRAQGGRLAPAAEVLLAQSELIKGDLLEAVAALKADAGISGMLIPGSISVVQQLLAAGLVDELRLLVHPVAARKGRRLFDDGDAPYHLKMTATERTAHLPAASPTALTKGRRGGPPSARTARRYGHRVSDRVQTRRSAVR
jgi:dihydrofolate reductase